jgi:MFS family permease
MSHAPLSDHLVHDAVGPPISALQAGATIGVGINSLMVLGILSILLGALGDEHRLSAQAIGWTAMVEVLCMGLTTAAMGLVRHPRRLRLVGAGVSVLLAVIDLASTQLADFGLMASRGAAGSAEGVLLWITISMIARTVTPERWAGVFFTVQTLGQFLLAVALAVLIMPRFGANGAFASLAVCSLLGVVPALLGPTHFPPLQVGAGESETPPPRGWFALAATLVFVAAGGAVGVYLQPLGHQAGLDAGVVRTAVWMSLAAQVAGGALATLLAGRVRYFVVFVATSVVSLAVWIIFALPVPAWLFIGANAVWGLVGVFLGPFLVPMTIDADPSRRAAMQSGAAQLLGGAFGPLLASQVVADNDLHGVLWLGAALILTGLAGVAMLRFSARRPALAPG